MKILIDNYSTGASIIVRGGEVAELNNYIEQISWLEWIMPDIPSFRVRDTYCGSNGPLIPSDHEEKAAVVIQRIKSKYKAEVVIRNKKTDAWQPYREPAALAEDAMLEIECRPLYRTGINTSANLKRTEELIEYFQKAYDFAPDENLKGRIGFLKRLRDDEISLINEKNASREAKIRTIKAIWE